MWEATTPRIITVCGEKSKNPKKDNSKILWRSTLKYFSLVHSFLNISMPFFVKFKFLKLIKIIPEMNNWPSADDLSMVGWWLIDNFSKHKLFSAEASVRVEWRVAAHGAFSKPIVWSDHSVAYGSLSIPIYRFVLTRPANRNNEKEEISVKKIEKNVLDN